MNHNGPGRPGMQNSIKISIVNNNEYINLLIHNQSWAVELVGILPLGYHNFVQNLLFNKINI